MNIGILGTGVVGQTLAHKLDRLGHQVMIGTRDTTKTLAKTGKNQYGGAPVSEWLKQRPSIKLGTFADAAIFGEMILNCLKGEAALDALKSAGIGNFNDKVVIDISNPLDFSKGMPPSLFVCNTDSLGERVQALLPGAHVVKTLNIVNCEVMVDAEKCGGDATMFVSGNNSDAKSKVRSLLNQFGWTDIIDLGDITTARGTEMLLPIWIRTWAATQNGHFAFKIVRK